MDNRLRALPPNDGSDNQRFFHVYQKRGLKTADGHEAVTVAQMLL